VKFGTPVVRPTRRKPAISPEQAGKCRSSCTPCIPARNVGSQHLRRSQSRFPPCIATLSKKLDEPGFVLKYSMISRGGISTVFDRWKLEICWKRVDDRASSSSD
jgi:hypothetical protein